MDKITAITFIVTASLLGWAFSDWQSQRAELEYEQEISGLEAQLEDSEYWVQHYKVKYFEEAR